MKATYYKDEDALYVELLDAQIVGGRAIGDSIHLDYSGNDEVVGVEFLNVSEGVELHRLPESLMDYLEPILSNLHNLVDRSCE